MFNVENRSQNISQYDERNHLEDYLSIRQRLKKELSNYKPEPYTRTKDQIEYNLKFFESKIKVLEKLK
jgi:hypothetical protein